MEGPRTKRYQYQGVSATGDGLEGTIEAIHLNQAKELLRLQGIQIVQIKPYKGATLNKEETPDLKASLQIAVQAAQPEKRAPQVFRSPPLIRELPDYLLRALTKLILAGRIWRPAEKLSWSRQFGALQKAGVPIDRSLALLRQENVNPRLAAIQKELAQKLLSGENFFDLLEQFRLFSPQEVAVLRAGSESGKLPENFERLVKRMEESLKFQRSIQSHLVQPALVILVLWIGFPLLGYGIGHLIATLSEATGDPKNLWLGAVLVHPLWMTICWVVPPATVLLGWYALRSPELQPRLHRIALRIPVFGHVMSKIQAATTLRALGQLLESGLSATDSLRLSSKVGYREELVRAEARIREGHTFSESLEGVFPKGAMHLLTAGEQTGEIGMMLLKAAELLEEETDYRMHQSLQLLEPLVLAFVGVLVGLVCFFSLSPLIHLTEKL